MEGGKNSIQNPDLNQPSDVVWSFILLVMFLFYPYMKRTKCPVGIRVASCRRRKLQSRQRPARVQARKLLDSLFVSRRSLTSQWQIPLKQVFSLKVYGMYEQRQGIPKMTCESAKGRFCPVWPKNVLMFRLERNFSLQSLLNMIARSPTETKKSKHTQFSK